MFPQFGQFVLYLPLNFFFCWHLPERVVRCITLYCAFSVQIVQLNAASANKVPLFEHIIHSGTDVRRFDLIFAPKMQWKCNRNSEHVVVTLRNQMLDNVSMSYKHSCRGLLFYQLLCIVENGKSILQKKRIFAPNRNLLNKHLLSHLKQMGDVQFHNSAHSNLF